MTDSVDDIWKIDSTYYFDNTDEKRSGNYAQKAYGKLYVKNTVSEESTINWVNCPTNAQVNKPGSLNPASTFYGVVSITVPAGSNEKAIAGEPFLVTMVTVRDGVTSTTTLEVTADWYADMSPSSSNISRVTILGMKITDSPSNGAYANKSFILGPSQMDRNTISVSQNTYQPGFPEVIKCFLAGVEIETPSGVKLVENLKVNDEIFTLKNNKKIIQKITRVFSKKTIVKNKDQFPIRILKSAISDNVPHKDLLITPEHCLFIQGSFIPARMLVNGSSIIQDTSFNSYKFYHIETAEHSIVTADGMLTESYLDTSTQVNSYLSIKGTKTWEEDAIAPLNTSRDFVEPIYKELEKRAQQKGLVDSRPKNILATDPNVFLTTYEDKKLLPLYTKDNCIAFRLPPGVEHVTLHSRSSRPSDIVGPFVDDRRYLGVLINSVTLSDINETSNIDTYLKIENLPGWSIQEDKNSRWTLGCAELPLKKRNTTTFGILRISILRGGPYILENVQTEKDKNVAA